MNNETTVCPTRGDEPWRRLGSRDWSERLPHTRVGMNRPARPGSRSPASLPHTRGDATGPA